MVIIGIQRYCALSTLAAAFTFLSVTNVKENGISWNSFVSTVFHSQLSALVMMNFCCTLLFLFFHSVVTIFFESLKQPEKEKLKESCANYLLFKSLMLVAIIDVETLDIFIKWFTWFALTGFIKALTIVAQNRFEYMSVTPTTPKKNFVYALILLSWIAMANILSIHYCLIFFSMESMSMLLLLLAETIVLFLNTIKALLQYGIHLKDLSSEEQSQYVYITHFGVDMLILFSTMMHYLHILNQNGLKISVLGIVVLINLKHIVHQMSERHSSFSHYRQIMRALDERFPDATNEEIDEIILETCAICINPLTSAKKLPCGHFFHRACLQRCFEKEMTQRAHRCPICRQPMIKSDDAIANSVAPSPIEEIPNINEEDQRPGNMRTNNDDVNDQAVFRISSDQLPSWIPIPRFSVELIRRGQVQPNNQIFFNRTNTAQTNATHNGETQTTTAPPIVPDVVMADMVSQVQSIFPQYPEGVIRNDLRNTLSVSSTIDNILSGAVVLEPATITTSTSIPRDVSTSTSNSTVSSGSRVLAHQYGSPQPHEANFIETVNTLQNSIVIEETHSVNTNSSLPRIPVVGGIPSIPSDNESREIRRRRTLAAIERRFMEESKN